VGLVLQLHLMTRVVVNYLIFSLQLNCVLLDKFLDVIQLVLLNGDINFHSLLDDLVQLNLQL